MLSDVADFLLDLRTMYDTLSARSHTIERYLRAARTIIATTADPTPIHETRRFFRELGGIEIQPTDIIFNRTLPREWISASGSRLTDIDDAGLRTALETNLDLWAAEARRQSDAIDELSARYSVPVATVPWRTPPPDSVDDLKGLIEASGLEL